MKGTAADKSRRSRKEEQQVGAAGWSSSGRQQRLATAAGSSGRHQADGQAEEQQLAEEVLVQSMSQVSGFILLCYTFNQIYFHEKAEIFTPGC
jgi:hypothetical protein